MRRALLIVVILAAQCALFEVGLRVYGGSEASPAFRSLFTQDPRIGSRPKPGAHARYTTVEFSTDIAINAQGVRDDQPIGPKAPGERRIVVLGDSLVFSVQVELQQTFCKLLETELNRRPSSEHWRVINAGVQGYSPIDQWNFYRYVAEQFDPDIVLVVAAVFNAPAVADKGALLDGRLPAAPSQAPTMFVRRLVRSSMVLQMVRARYDQLSERFQGAVPEPALATYLADPPAKVAQGLEVTRRALGLIADRAASHGARTAIVLMPARLQVNDQDYGYYVEAIRQAGGTLIRDAATDRYREAMTPLGVPMFDLLPALKAQPNRANLFFERNVHLTPRGHQVVADALFQFLTTSGLIASSGR